MKEKERIYTIKLWFIFDLPANPSPVHLRQSFSSAGLSDVPVPLWNEAHSNKHSASGATVESPRWASKKNILGFICIARSLCSHVCLDVVVHSGTGPPYSSLDRIKCAKVKILHLLEEWDWNFLTSLDTFDTFLRQTPKFVLQAPLLIKYVCTPSQGHTGVQYPVLDLNSSTPHRGTTWGSAYARAAAWFSRSSLYLLDVCCNPFSVVLHTKLCRVAALSFFLLLSFHPEQCTEASLTLSHKPERPLFLYMCNYSPVKVNSFRQWV